MRSKANFKIKLLRILREVDLKRSRLKINLRKRISLNSLISMSRSLSETTTSVECERKGCYTALVLGESLYLLRILTRQSTRRSKIRLTEFDFEDLTKTFKKSKTDLNFARNKDDVFNTTDLSKRTTVFYRNFAESTLENDIEREKKKKNKEKRKMGLKLSKDLRNIKNKAKMYSSNNFKDAIRHSTSIKLPIKPRIGQIKVPNIVKAEPVLPKSNHQSCLSQELDEINAQLKQAIGLTLYSSCSPVKTPVKKFQRVSRLIAALPSISKDTFSSRNRKCLTPEFHLESHIKHEVCKMTKLGLKKESILSEPKSSTLRNVYTPCLDMLNSKIYDIAKIKLIKNPNLRRKVEACIQENHSKLSKKCKLSKVSQVKSDTTASSSLAKYL